MWHRRISKRFPVRKVTMKTKLSIFFWDNHSRITSERSYVTFATSRCPRDPVSFVFRVQSSNFFRDHFHLEAMAPGTPWVYTQHIRLYIQVNLIRQQMTLFLPILFTKNERKTSFSIRIYQTSGGSLEITKHYYQWTNINHFWSFVWLMAMYSFDSLLVRNESVWYGACVHMSCSIRHRTCLN